MAGTFRLGTWLVEPSLNFVLRNGVSIHLTPKVMGVLVCLAEHAGDAVSKEVLLETVWPDTFVGDDVLKGYISDLRRVLEDDAREPEIIQTIPKTGYRLIAPVEWIKGTEFSTHGTEKSHALPGNHRKLRMAALVVIFAVVPFVLVLSNVRSVRSWLTSSAATPQIHSLAVLPLRSLSSDPNQEYFSDGLTDALITDLAQIGSIKVISHTSTMQYKNTEKSLREIARELNVDGIVEGTVQRSGDRVRITAQLIETASDHHLWAESYERDLKDVLALQDEVTRDIVDEIRVKLNPEERTRLMQGRSVNPEVLEACLKGRFYYEKQSIPAFNEAANYYRQAIAHDPAYAPAYIGLAAAYKELGVWGALPPREAASQAADAVERALALNDNSGDAHAVLGHIHFLWDWDWPGAEREYKRAFELGPPSTDTSIQYAVYLSAMGRHDEAVTVMRKARASDPVSQASNGLLGTIYYWSHRFDEAVDQFHKDLALHPDSAFAHGYLGRCFERKAMYADAVEEYLQQKALGGVGEEELTRFRQAFVRSGMKGFLREELKSAMASSNSRYIDPFWIAILHARLGDNDQAFRWLQSGVQQRSHNLALISTEPMLDGLHSDPRFQDLLRRIGLPQ